MRWPSRRRRFLSGVLVSLVIGAALCMALGLDLLHGIQLQSSDLLSRATNAHGEIGSENRIVVVRIDDKSLDQLGRFSLWPRSHHAKLIDVLAAAEARVVVFDILFAEPAPGDDALAHAIKSAGNVVLPIVYAPKTGDAIGASAVDQSDAFIRPLEVLERDAVAVGHASIIHDVDGIVRRLPLVIRDGEDYEQALALAAVARYLRHPAVIESSIRNDELLFAGRSIPLVSGSEMLINYAGSVQQQEGSADPRSVSFVDVLNGDIEPGFFEDRIVVVGVAASGLGDAFWTPAGQMMHGVEIHAAAMRTILDGKFLKQAAFGTTVATIVLLALMCGLAALRLRVLGAAFSAVGLCLAYLLIAVSLLDQGIMLNTLYPPLAIAGAFVGVNLHNIASERSEKREITSTFGRYISPSVVEKTLAALDEGRLRLGGDEHEITVVFADVRDFTAVSESMRPEQLVSTLNIYLSRIIEAVLDHHGMINKFGGDSIMAIWNVPTECEDHALLATKAAIAAQCAIRRLHTDSGLPRMDFGIGVNTGVAVAGNMGSEHRLEYSVIGDVVNTAARLASATPGGSIWIGADTFQTVKKHIRARPLRPLALKGKREPIQTYEVVCVTDPSIDHEGSVTDHGYCSSYS